MKLRRMLGLLLALCMAAAAAPTAQGAELSPYAPGPAIEYDYAPAAVRGTVRYVSQVHGDGDFHAAYWPDAAFGAYSSPEGECGTASMSMALSYLGVNYTPRDLLEPQNGVTRWLDWGGAVHDKPTPTEAIDNYLSGGGAYSPVVIHVPYYTGNGHYMVIVGRSDADTYQILDPWARAVTSAVIQGTVITYEKNGVQQREEIDEVHQWYCAEAAQPAPAPDLRWFRESSVYVPGRFSDVSAGAWYEAAVAKVCALGLFRGVSDTAFDPLGSVTVAQLAMLGARLHAIYHGGDGDFPAGDGAWYQGALDYLAAVGTVALPEDGSMDRAAARAEVAELLCGIFAEELTERNTVPLGAIPDVPAPSPHSEAVYAMYRAGIVWGSDAQHNFCPAAGITRAETAAIILRILDPASRLTFTM